MPNYTAFRDTTGIGKMSDSEKIKFNLIYFLDWAFINVGAYDNVNIPESGAYGGNEHILRRVDDPRFTTNSVWEGFRGNWIWESGVSQDVQPIAYSGVFVGNNYHEKNSNHYVDYINGRIVFDSGISSTSTVKAEYSYKLINIYDNDDTPFFREIQYNSYRVDDNSFTQTSGNWSQFKENRIQLPAIFIEMANKRSDPYELGGGNFFHNTDVVFHVLAEEGTTADRIAERLYKQNEMTIKMFDPDIISESGKIPLDYRGSLNANALTFPDLVDTYRWNGLRFYDAQKQSITKLSQGLYHIPVRITTQIIL